MILTLILLFLGGSRHKLINRLIKCYDAERRSIDFKRTMRFDHIISGDVNVRHRQDSPTMIINNFYKSHFNGVDLFDKYWYQIEYPHKTK